MMLEVSDVTIYQKCFSLPGVCSTMAPKLFENTCDQHLLTNTLCLKKRKHFKRLAVLKLITFLTFCPLTLFATDLEVAVTPTQSRFMNFVSSGFPEFSPGAQIAFEQMKATINAAYIKYGYAPLETPAIERVGTIAAKGIGNKEIYALRRLQADEGEGEIDLAL